jgi:hypothetical protein
VVLALLLSACTTGPASDGRPPGVSAPGPATTPTATVVAPGPDRWAGAIVSLSYHDLYVGGRCESDWRTTLRFRIRQGRVSGSGEAVRTSTGPPCPFPVAQLQIQVFRLDVGGTLQGARLDLRLRERSFTPVAGADDLGGFRATTLGTVLRLSVHGGAVRTRIRLRAPDQDRGTFGSANVVRLSCRSC